MATQLLQFVIREAKKNNIFKLQLEVRQSNSVAIALYAQLGFVQVAVRKKYYQDNEDAVVMDYNTKIRGE